MRGHVKVPTWMLLVLAALLSLQVFVRFEASLHQFSVRNTDADVGPSTKWIDVQPIGATDCAAELRAWMACIDDTTATGDSIGGSYTAVSVRQGGSEWARMDRFDAPLLILAIPRSESL